MSIKNSFSGRGEAVPPQATQLDQQASLSQPKRKMLTTSEANRQGCERCGVPYDQFFVGHREI